jgi:hypothetical protein
LDKLRIPGGSFALIRGFRNTLRIKAASPLQYISLTFGVTPLLSGAALAVAAGKSPQRCAAQQI